MSETAAEVARLSRFLPFDAYEWKTVTFLLPNTDVPVTHSLPVSSPNDVLYIEFARRAVLTIWDGRSDPTAPCPAWTRTKLYLRSTTAPQTVKLLLVTPRGAPQQP